MAATVLPQKRILAESRSNQNVPSSPSSAKKRKTDAPSSSPAVRFSSSQNGNRLKLGSTQPKSVFETEVLEKLSQDISNLKQSNAEKDQSWGRPPVEDFDPERDSLCFQSIEAEEGTLHGAKATVKLFGINDTGNSVMLHVTDFKHYLYVPAPSSFQPQDCVAYRTFLEARLALPQSAIHTCTLTNREDIYGFRGNKMSPYIKITVTDPKHISKVRAMLEDGNANWKGLWKNPEGKIQTYDNIQYVLRFMVDCKVWQQDSEPASLAVVLTCHRSKVCHGWKPLRQNISLLHTADNPTAKSRPK